MIAELTYSVAAAVATATPKDPEASQDRAGVLSTPAGAGAVVCDGVGSLADSGAVAERCVALATAHVLAEGVRAGIVSCPGAVAEALAQEPDGRVGASTLLAVGAEQDGSCVFTMVGNGAIIALEPFVGAADRTELGFAELVLPQVQASQGQAALRSFLPAPADPVERASGLLFAHGRPRLLLACTDGVTTLEDRRVGRVPSGELWQPLLAPFASVLHCLAVVWDDLAAGEGGDELLTEALQAGLDRARERGQLDDDATVGAVLVLPEVAA